jgi:hypothetical protein
MPDLSMRQEQTANAMSGLSDAGDSWQQTWSASEAAINGLDGQLGKGILGQAFTEGYQSAKAAAVNLASRSVATPGQLATAGQQSVSIYGNADAWSAAGFGANPGG